MNKYLKITLIIIATLFIAGCEKNKIEKMAENLKRIELTGNLVTYQAYYHNVIEYEKKAGSGLFHLFEKDRKLFAEYTGIIKIGINLSKVKIETKGKEINVFIPKAIIIGEPQVDNEDFKPENFIESEDGWLNKNPLTAEDSAKALDFAQNNMKETASHDDNLLSLAQKRAKVVIEENINQFSGISSSQYVINWKYEE